MSRIKRINHIGIAVRNAEEALKFYADVLGLEVAHTEVVEREGVKTVFLPVGESSIELLEPLNADSPIAKTIEKRGEGIAHICIEVEGIDEMLKPLGEIGAVIGEAKSRPGAHGTKVAFLHPKATRGVLIELAEPAGEEH